MFLKANSLGIFLLMTHVSVASASLITHGTSTIKNHRQRLQNAESLTLSLEEELALLQQLSEFDFGRFLLENRGISGYWTAYMILHGPQKQLDHPLEKWILTKAPILLATQERFQIFQKHMQKYVRSDMKIAAVPCGLMDSLLLLDYSGTQNVQLIGIDLDKESLQLAQINAKKQAKEKMVSFLNEDAWHLSTQNEYDMMTSNGLNFYEADDQKVTALYGQFYKALKRKGILVTSFLTPSPTLSSESTWRDFDPEDQKKQIALFKDIIQVRFQVYRTEAQTCKQLESIGFKVLDVIYDRQGMFPTIIAQKS
jgi:ubiquinone/menaquinone biosynthesis C-methylase UbiE